MFTDGSKQARGSVARAVAAAQSLGDTATGPCRTEPLGLCPRLQARPPCVRGAAASCHARAHTHAPHVMPTPPPTRPLCGISAGVSFAAGARLAAVV